MVERGNFQPKTSGTVSNFNSSLQRAYSAADELVKVTLNPDIVLDELEIIARQFSGIDGDFSFKILNDESVEVKIEGTRVLLTCRMWFR